MRGKPCLMGMVYLKLWNARACIGDANAPADQGDVLGACRRLGGTIG